MPTLIIAFMEPNGFSTIFPPGKDSSSCEGFHSIATDLLAHIIMHIGTIIEAPLILVTERAQYLGKHLENVSTLIEKDFAISLNSNESELRTTLSYTFKDGTDLSMFCNDPDEAMPMQIFFSTNQQEQEISLHVVCIAYEH